MAAKAKRHAGWMAGGILGAGAGIRVGLLSSNLGESETIVALWIRIQLGIHENGGGRNTDLCVSRNLKPIREAIWLMDNALKCYCRTRISEQLMAMGEDGKPTKEKRIETLGFFHDAVEFDKLIERALLNETVLIQDRFGFFTKRFYIFRHGAKVVYQLGWSSCTRMNCCERNLEVTVFVSPRVIRGRRVPVTTLSQAKLQDSWLPLPLARCLQ